MEITNNMKNYISGVSSEYDTDFNNHSVKFVLPCLFGGMKDKWQVKERALGVLKSIAEKYPENVSYYLPEIVPVVSDCMNDLRSSVKTIATDTLISCCSSIGNKDIEPFVPHLIRSISNINDVADCIHKLSATTFVQNVDSRVLSILVPLLSRGIVDRTTPVKRKTCVIINNMAKLVDDPADAFEFSEKLLKDVKFAMESMSNPEARSIATTCFDYLDNIHHNVCHKMSFDQIKDCVSTVVKDTLVEYVSCIVDSLIKTNSKESDTWADGMFPVLTTVYDTTEAANISHVLFEKFQTDDTTEEKETEPGEDLCDCEFSLAYGGKILLNGTRLNLKRGNRYGLIGPNGAGKSTLMRAIANGQLEGFPPANQVRTVYVEHDIDSSESETTVFDFITNDETVRQNTTSIEKISSVLESVGFDASRQASTICSLSGGWKMKLALARAMLMNADVLLLDEVS